MGYGIMEVEEMQVVNSSNPSSPYLLMPRYSECTDYGVRVSIIRDTRITGQLSLTGLIPGGHRAVLPVWGLDAVGCSAGLISQ